jgi:hypothetical protein
MVSETYDAPIRPENSSTGHGLTKLTYLVDDPDSGRPLVTITLDITADEVGVVVATEDFYGNGNPGPRDPGSPAVAFCDAAFSRVEAAAFDGTISCRDAPVIIHETGERGYELDMEATFAATR